MNYTPFWRAGTVSPPPKPPPAPPKPVANQLRPDIIELLQTICESNQRIIEQNERLTAFLLTLKSEPIPSKDYED